MHTATIFYVRVCNFYACVFLLYVLVCVFELVLELCMCFLCVYIFLFCPLALQCMYTRQKVSSLPALTSSILPTVLVFSPLSHTSSSLFFVQQLFHATTLYFEHDWAKRRRTTFLVLTLYPDFSISPRQRRAHIQFILVDTCTTHAHTAHTFWNQHFLKQVHFSRNSKNNYKIQNKPLNRSENRPETKKNCSNWIRFWTMTEDSINSSLPEHIQIQLDSANNIITSQAQLNQMTGLTREIVLPNFGDGTLSLTADLIREASESAENVENLGQMMESNAQGRPLSHKCPKCPYRSAWRSCVLTHMKLKHSSKLNSWTKLICCENVQRTQAVTPWIYFSPNLFIFIFNDLFVLQTSDRGDVLNALNATNWSTIWNNTWRPLTASAPARPTESQSKTKILNLILRKYKHVLNRNTFFGNYEFQTHFFFQKALFLHSWPFWVR